MRHDDQSCVGGGLKDLRVLTLPLFVCWQSVLISQLYRFVDWVFFVMNATQCTDLTHVNSRSVGRLFDGYSGAIG